MNLQHLPLSLYAGVLSDWVSFQSFVQFDIACCNEKMRMTLMRLYPLLILEDQILSSEAGLIWLSKRKIRMKSLALNRNYHKNLFSPFCLNNLQLLRVCNIKWEDELFDLLLSHSKSIGFVELSSLSNFGADAVDTFIGLSNMQSLKCIAIDNISLSNVEIRKVLSSFSGLLEIKLSKVNPDSMQLVLQCIDGKNQLETVEIDEFLYSRKENRLVVKNIKEHAILEIVKHFADLAVLDMTRNEWSGDILAILEKYHQTLQIVRLHAIPAVNVDRLNEILTLCPKLKEFCVIQLQGVEFLRIWKAHPALQRVECKDMLYDRYQRLLRILYLGDFSVESLQSLVTAEIEQVVLDGRFFYGCIGDVLEHIHATCRSLRCLSLSWFQNVKLSDLHLVLQKHGRSVESLKFEGCIGLRDKYIADLLHYLPNIRYLECRSMERNILEPAVGRSLVDRLYHDWSYGSFSRDVTRKIAKLNPHLRELHLLGDYLLCMADCVAVVRGCPQLEQINTNELTYLRRHSLSVSGTHAEDSPSSQLAFFKEIRNEPMLRLDLVQLEWKQQHWLELFECFASTLTVFHASNCDGLTDRCLAKLATSYRKLCRCMVDVDADRKVSFSHSWASLLFTPQKNVFYCSRRIVQLSTPGIRFNLSTNSALLLLRMEQLQEGDLKAVMPLLAQTHPFTWVQISKSKAQMPLLVQYVFPALAPTLKDVTFLHCDEDFKGLLLAIQDICGGLRQVFLDRNKVPVFDSSDEKQAALERIVVSVRP